MAGREWIVNLEYLVKGANRRPAWGQDRPQASEAVWRQVHQLRNTPEGVSGGI
jgi:hypothetical protein